MGGVQAAFSLRSTQEKTREASARRKESMQVQFVGFGLRCVSYLAALAPAYLILLFARRFAYQGNQLHLTISGSLGISLGLLQSGFASEFAAGKHGIGPNHDEPLDRQIHCALGRPFCESRCPAAFPCETRARISLKANPLGRQLLYTFGTPEKGLAQMWRISGTTSTGDLLI